MTVAVLIHLIETFGEGDETVDIVLSNLWVVVNQLTELGLETTAEESNGGLVVEV